MKLIKMIETDLGRMTIEIEAMNGAHDYPCSAYEFLLFKRVIETQAAVNRVEKLLEELLDSTRA